MRIIFAHIYKDKILIAEIVTLTNTHRVKKLLRKVIYLVAYIFPFLSSRINKPSC
jgi:hypothetical protein